MINFISEIFTGLINLFKNRYFYIGTAVLFTGIQLNFYSQNYLLGYIKNGHSLPVLNDLILDNIPYWDIDYLYDIFSIVSLLVLVIYVIHKKKYEMVPYYLLLSGILQSVRGIFIILTPFGHPAGFDGTEGIFNGFTNIELGVYPSGHVGISYLYFLVVKGNWYRITLLFSTIIIIFALFLSRGHYTIDILSGILFAYAIKSFGDRCIIKFINNNSIY